MSSTQVDFFRLRKISRVKTPVPGPYSTIHSALSKSIFAIIFRAKNRELGKIAPVVRGFSKYCKTKDSFAIKSFPLFYPLLHYTMSAFICTHMVRVPTSSKPRRFANPHRKF
jgi:hypothetical protein